MHSLLHVSVAALAVIILPAQSFRDERKQHLPDVLMPRPYLLDVDRDGDLDAILSGSPVRMLLNLGRLRFADITAQAMPPLAGTPRASADLDGDSQIDLFISGPELLLNQGGSFSLASSGRLPPLNSPTRALALGDVDGDGDADAFVGGQFQSWVLRNNGAAMFAAAATHADATGAEIARLFDADGDRDLDLLVSSPVRSVLLRNDGSGEFTPVAGAVPLLGLTEVAVADVDGDGDLDLVASNVNFTAPRQLFGNDGTGRFLDITATHLPPTGAGFVVALATPDVDGDGDVDLLIARNDFDSELLRNDGSGRFHTSDVGDLRTLRSPVPAAGDLDGDGLVDLLTHPTHVLAGRARAGFVLVDGAALEPEAHTLDAVADFTGDGDLDLLQTLAEAFYVVQRNDGTGTFRPSYYSPALPRSAVLATAVGDIDGDGDIDVLRSSLEPGNVRTLSILRNDGRGVFTGPERTPLPSNSGLVSLYLDDLDADGDADAIDIGGAGIAVLVNDGSGNFTSGARLNSFGVSSSDLFDYDRDGDRDLFLGGADVRLFENQQGTFVDVSSQRFATPPGVGLPRLTAIGGRIYLFVCGSQIRVLEAGGSGFVARPEFTYTATSSPLGARVLPVAPNELSADLVLRRSPASNPSVQVLRFNGFGLIDVTTSVLGDTPFQDVEAAGDLDHDGDLDLIAQRSGTDRRVLRGIQRSLRVPFAAFVGHDLEFRLTEATATAGNPALAILLLGPGLTRIPLPGLGILRVEPTSAVLLPTITIATPNPVSIALRVPANVELRDLALIAQPLFVYPTRGFSVLGSAVREIVR
jgi:hypothetical protein